MGKFLRQPANADDTEICPVCKENDKGDIQLHAEMVEYQGSSKPRWKNPDGTSHIGRPDTNFAHVIPTSNFQVAQNVSQQFTAKAISNPLEQEILAHSERLESNNNAKNFAAHYHAVRRIFEKSVVDIPDKRVQGMVVGNMLSAYLTGRDIPLLTSSETECVEAKLTRTSQLSNSATALKDLSSGSKQTVRQNVKQLLSDYPLFSTNKKSGNEKIELYIKVFGAGVQKESITRAFRHELNSDVKHYDEAENYVEWYQNGVKIE